MNTALRWPPFLRRKRPHTRICPYCFLTIEDGSQTWRCRRPPPLATDARDDGTHGGSGDAEQAAQPASEAEPTASYCDTHYRDALGSCPQCHGTTPRIPTCPRCRFVLPIGWYDRQALSIGLLGESGSGKTHYIVALHAWWQTYLNRFSMSFLPEMLTEHEQSFAEIRHRVMARQVLVRTQDNDSHVFLWDVHSSTHGWLNQPFYLFYHDTAGENLVNLDRTRPRSGYVLAANMLVFLIDGARLRPVEVALNPACTLASSSADDRRADWADDARGGAGQGDGPSRSTTSDADADEFDPREAIRVPHDGAPANGTAAAGDRVHRAEMESPTRSLQGVIRFLREQTDNSRRRLRVPIAVCLNKSDEVGRAFPGFRDAINVRPRHDGFFDLRACARLSDVTERYLREELEQGNLVEIIRSHFSDYMFFPTATLGSGLVNDGSSDEYYQWAPLGVEDPFLWILWMRGRIPALHD